MTKSCSKCKAVKPYAEFDLDKRSRTGVTSQCVPCRREYVKHRYQTNEHVRRTRHASRYRRLYGISVEIYEHMFKKQAGLCAICKLPSSNRALSVDHDHETGKVRELLCDNCNRAIGLLKDDPERARTAAEYLERHKR